MKIIFAIFLLTTSISTGFAKTYHTLVVGGGIAGMSAAHELKKAGKDVLLLEASSKIGGKLQTDSIDGIPFDWAAQSLAKNSSFIVPLIKELGLEHEKENISGSFLFSKKGEFFKINPDDKNSIFSSGLLDKNYDLKKVKLLAEMIKVTPFVPWSNRMDHSRWHHLDDQNAKDYALQFFDKKAVEYFFESAVSGFFFTNLEKTSKAFFIGFMFTMFTEGTPFFSFKNGLGLIAEEMAKHFPHRLSSRVELIEKSKALVKVTLTNGEVFKAKNLVLAVPAPVVKKIYPQRSAEEERALKTITGSAVVLTIKTKKDWRNDPLVGGVYGISFPPVDKGPFASISLESSKGKKVPLGQEIIQVFLSREKSKEALALDMNETYKLIEEELEKIFPGVTKATTHMKMKKFWHGMPELYVGKAVDLNAYKEWVLNTKPQVIFAGDHVNIPGLNGSRYSGLWAAEVLLKR